jgi:hypothetical protein
MTMSMADASIKVTRKVRDRLGKIAEEYGGTTLNEALDKC